MLSGTAPVPASSGRTGRHRLNRLGDRQLNRAIHTIAVTWMRCHPATIAHAQPLHRGQDRPQDPPLHQALPRPPPLPNPYQRQPYQRLTNVGASLARGDLHPGLPPLGGPPAARKATPGVLIKIRHSHVSRMHCAPASLPIGQLAVTASWAPYRISVPNTCTLAHRPASGCGPSDTKRSPAWHNLATLAHWCRTEGYLDSAAATASALNAIRDTLAGKPWLPSLSAVGGHHSRHPRE